MRRRDFMQVGAGFGLAVAGLAPPRAALSQARAVFKAADVQPAGYPTVVATENLGRKLAAASNGRLSLQMYPSMQLGAEKETLEQTQIGAIQMLRVSAGAVGPIVDDINVVNMPFLFRDTAHAQKIMDGEIGQELLERITAHSRAGLVALGWMDSGARSLYNTRRPIKSIDDLKGLKFRVIGNPIFIDMMNALGGNGVAMGYDQVFSALQTGVIDGAENNPPSYVFSNHMNVCYFADRLPARGRALLGLLVQLLMALVAGFMIVWGTSLVEVTWYNSMADFPALSVGVTYLPIPIGGACLLLFIIERIFLGIPEDPIRHDRDVTPFD